MLWVYDQYEYVDSYSAGMDSIPVLLGLKSYLELDLRWPLTWLLPTMGVYIQDF